MLKSRMTPCCHRKARVWNPSCSMEKGSEIALVDHPVTWPRLLTESAKLSFPPTVPRLMIWPCFVQRTPRSSGPPSGSIRSVSEPPTMNPFWLIHEAPLLWTPGSDPRSAMTPFCHRKAWYPGDLSAIVDSERYCQFQAGVTISNQAVQLKDRAVLPQHRTVM